MEEKKLNFEKPLLSARRLTSGTSPENGSKWNLEYSVRSVRRPPPYNSELKSGPVSNPGTVPFEWEQIPGRPKDGETRLESDVAEIYTVPKLPPGRTLRVGQQDCGEAVIHTDQTRSVSHDSRDVQSTDGDVKQSGSSRDGKEEVENCSLGNEDEEFLDALETLSRADSLLTNCSLGCFSELENPGMKVSGTSPIDSQTRDFMLGRFLPAAKAMASETAQHAPRKPPVVLQQPRQLHNLVKEDKRPQLRYGPDFALEYSQRHCDGDEESDAGYDEGEIFRGKACSLLPGLGLRSSNFLLNTLPGMRSSAPMLLRKSQTKASSWSCNKSDLPSFRELLGEDDRFGNSGLGSSVAEKTLYVDTEHTLQSLHVKPCASDTNAQTEPEVKKHETIRKKGATSGPKFQIPDFHIVSSRGGADQETRLAMQKPSGQEQDGFRGSKMDKENITNSPTGQQNPESKLYSEFLAPPPLIKSPSDSWLGRTLPSISTKKSSVHSYRGTWMAPKDQASKPKSSDPKWETMVRRTKMQDKHLCFSEDWLTPIPEA